MFANRWTWYLLVIASLSFVTLQPATAAAFANRIPIVGRAHSRVETQLTDNGSDTTQGEPEIGINPRNPRNLFIAWTTFPVPLVFPPSSLDFPHPCGGLVSEDGGLSWEAAYLPLDLCGDAVVAFGPDGTLYAGGIVPEIVSERFEITGHDAVLRSMDGGHTWGSPVETMGSDSERFVPGSGSPENAFDRPWLAVDQSTGTVYASGANLADHERFITASNDQAQSFGPIYAVDSPDYPGGGGTIAAARGVLAVAYTASEAPDASCPCVVFETSTDQGATFSRHVVPLVDASANPFLAADPTRKGRFALTVLDATGTKLQVYVTADSGKTWHGPALVGEPPANPRFKPWLSYSPSGKLVLVWRTQYDDQSYDVWYATGRSGGLGGPQFGAPVRVSSAAAPYPPQYGGGDDLSWIVADRTTVHIGWGDSRNGPTQLWYAHFKLNAGPSRLPRRGVPGSRP